MSDLKLLGSNIGLGRGVVEMSASRRALPAVEEGLPFPLGFCGLIPIESIRKSGAAKVAYALPLGDEGTSWNIEDATFLKADETELPDDFSPNVEVLETVDAELMDAEDLRELLEEAVEAINDMLDLAAEITDYPFGYVDSVRIGVPWRGAGYTRVLYRPRGEDEEDSPSSTPIHLVVETSIDPGTPNSLTAIVRYDRRGEIFSMLLTEFGEDGYWCRVEASINFDTHVLDVYKVEESDGKHANGRLLYKRGYKSFDSYDDYDEEDDRYDDRYDDHYDDRGGRGGRAQWDGFDDRGRRGGRENRSGHGSHVERSSRDGFDRRDSRDGRGSRDDFDRRDW